MFEILAFEKLYFVENTDLTPFYNFINKSYAKTRYKFNIINSNRIKSPSSYLNDIQLDDYKDYVSLVLLGPKGVCAQLNRRFDQEATNLEEAFNCDIPEDYLDELKFDKNAKVKITRVSNDYNLKTDLYRVLGSCGLLLEDILTNSLKFELSLFTSFMRGLGSKLLDFVIDNYLKTLMITDFFHLEMDNEKLTKITLDAVVIRDHNLVDYYVNKCGFKQSDRPDLTLNPSANDMGPFEMDLKSHKPFNVAFIYRDIPIKY